MKILAAPPNHPLFKCMLKRIVYHVKVRYASRWSLAITGPQLLHNCYDKVKGYDDVDISITYRDSRNAMWPYSGLMGRKGLVAFEVPVSDNYDDEDVEKPAAGKKTHYHELLEKGVLYDPQCSLAAA